MGNFQPALGHICVVTAFIYIYICLSTIYSLPGPIGPKHIVRKRFLAVAPGFSGIDYNNDVIVHDGKDRGTIPKMDQHGFCPMQGQQLSLWLGTGKHTVTTVVLSELGIIQVITHMIYLYIYICF